MDRHIHCLSEHCSGLQPPDDLCSVPLEAVNVGSESTEVRSPHPLPPPGCCNVSGLFVI
jgi:hypothetical protein